MKNLSLFFIPVLILHFGFSCTPDKKENVRVEENFNSAWKFYLGDRDEAQEAGFDDSGWRRLDLPHDWSVEGSFSDKWASGTGYLPGGIGWYRKTLCSEISDREAVLDVEIEIGNDHDLDPEITLENIFYFGGEEVQTYWI